VIGGRELTTETKKIPIFQGSRVAKVVTCIMDLSDVARAAARLKESEEKYRVLVESTDDSIYLVDRECHYLFMNKKHMTRMGFAGDEFLGRSYADYHSRRKPSGSGKRSPGFWRPASPCAMSTGAGGTATIFPDLSPVKQEGGGISAVTVVSKDVTVLKNLEEELRSLSLTDALTGLHNRRGFFTLAELQLRLADRRKQGMYMLYADMDGLKQINDTYGHQEGDRALSENGQSPEGDLSLLGCRLPDRRRRIRRDPRGDGRGQHRDHHQPFSEEPRGLQRQKVPQIPPLRQPRHRSVRPAQTPPPGGADFGGRCDDVRAEKEEAHLCLNRAGRPRGAHGR